MQVSSRLQGVRSLGAISGVATLLFATALLVALAPPASAAPKSKSYIVVLNDDVAHPANVAERHEESRGAKVSHVYGAALKGYSAELSPSALKAIKQDPNVDYVEPDWVAHLTSQAPPFSVYRVYANRNSVIHIDEKEDVKLDVDVAVIDSGVATHPDLNVAGRTDCIWQPCEDGRGSDEVGHGTMVAGFIGARDNNYGVVGTAPGARIWSVKVCWELDYCAGSAVIAGINWVTAHSDAIEVANMSMGSAGNHQSEHEAILASQSKGVVYVVSAGNEEGEYGTRNVTEVSPAGFPEVVTVSAMTDFDAVPGGLTETSLCGPYGGSGVDDHFAEYSNWGPGVDITAPGTCNLTTLKSGGYGVEQEGTSFSAPLVSGAAALLASRNNPNSAADVQAIRDTLVRKGSYYWADTSGDGSKEPLLDMRRLGGSVQRSAATLTETDPTPFRTSSGEFNVFARATTGEQISFGRSGAGAWSVYNETSVMEDHPLVQSTQSVIQTANGELLVFARNTDNELVEFGRTPGGAWFEWDLTPMVNGEPLIAGDPVAVQTSAGELLVFARTTSNELVSFIRAANGAWSVYNETAIVAGHPTIVGKPSVYDWGGGVLSVFARTTNNELISFERTGSGVWSVFNETAVVPGHPSISDSPVALMTTVGSEKQLLVFARTTTGELVNFLRQSNGGWSVYNETAVTPGNPKILGTPKPMITSAGELLVFARSNNNELISFSRSTGGAWSVYNETAIVPGTPHILSSPAPFDWGGGVLSIFARSSNNELISFERTGAGAWSIYNETAVVAGHPHIE